ncbi:MAG: hypothetical protein DCF19_05155 [Pseudanabaena frigida]|uniref:Uncharacterized protein n=1 Tax=Pseudanabaena frigida TaxID=945775 RepID=A0A2W4WEM5_9CYAN|nr:MAG: hypothetical protein DCF19_05155 [Pseudanabaena frigida]
MLSIAELAHQRDPEAIAEIIRQELQPLNVECLKVEADIVDSSLELKIQANSAIDKEKLLTLVRSEFQNLHIESVAKFRIHCWRNDEDMPEQRLLWTEQFMLEPLRTSLSQTLELELDNIQSSEVIALETREPEPQLSKNSVLQQAIAKISTNNHSELSHLLANNTSEQSSIDVGNLSPIALNPNDAKPTTPSVIEHNYWQLLLVGLSIVLLGLGIGAAVRAITIRNVIEANSSANPANSSVNNNSVKDKPTNTTKNISSQRSESPAIQSKDLSPTNRSASTATVLASPNSSEPLTSAYPKVSQDDEAVITLEKFNRIQKGMTIEQVEKVLGTSGKVIAENNSTDSIGKVYSWKNPQGSNAIVEFKDGQVVAKAQAGL